MGQGGGEELSEVPQLPRLPPESHVGVVSQLSQDSRLQLCDVHTLGH